MVLHECDPTERVTLVCRICDARLAPIAGRQADVCSEDQRAAAEDMGLKSFFDLLDDIEEVDGEGRLLGCGF